ncbi:MAG TPA: hypothetical protein VMG31_12390 [Verrucomicrobiae bacterium]|nr:hypothetical protein [Verrucomicrobiae bacterium]
MGSLIRSFAALFVALCLCSLIAQAQDDSPSLGDVARQTRQQKQQRDTQAAPTPGKNAESASPEKSTSAVAAPAKNPQPAPVSKRVITNDEIPEHIGPTSTRASASKKPATQAPPPGDDDNGQDGKLSAEEWTSQIQTVKSNIALLQRQISDLTASIQYVGGNCVSGCEQWNAQQKEKQDEVESLKAEVEQQQKALEDMQEAARKQGYGSSVYDP